MHSDPAGFLHVQASKVDMPRLSASTSNLSNPRLPQGAISRPCNLAGRSCDEQRELIGSGPRRGAMRVGDDDDGARQIFAGTFNLLDGDHVDHFDTASHQEAEASE